jgi:hypothetical protein
MLMYELEILNLTVGLLFLVISIFEIVQIGMIPPSFKRLKPLSYVAFLVFLSALNLNVYFSELIK